MIVLLNVIWPGRFVRHLNPSGDNKTVCGLNVTWHAREIDSAEARKYPLCSNCDRTRARYTTDKIEPEIEAGATRRGGVLADEGRVREVTGRMFRVAGSTNTYTIAIPSDKDLASTCTCMAAKTHPEIMCKHQSAVYLTIGGGA